MTTPRTNFPARRPRPAPFPPRRDAFTTRAFTTRAFTTRAFTMTELLIVIGLIVLVIALALPAFNAITGGRSIDAAENNASAVLTRAREDALALQEPRGVIFFTDPDTARVTLAEVYFPSTSSNILELLPDREEMPLPNGVGGQAFANDGTASVPSGLLPVGVVMFDGYGRIAVQTYSFTTNGKNPDNSPNQLRARLPATALANNVVSNVGFVLYDQNAYNEALNQGGNQAQLRDWVNDNATPFLVNRYNGTLARAGE